MATRLTEAEASNYALVFFVCLVALCHLLCLVELAAYSASSSFSSSSSTSSSSSSSATDEKRRDAEIDRLRAEVKKYSDWCADAHSLNYEPDDEDYIQLRSNELKAWVTIRRGMTTVQKGRYRSKSARSTNAHSTAKALALTAIREAQLAKMKACNYFIPFLFQLLFIHIVLLIISMCSRS